MRVGLLPRVAPALLACIALVFPGAVTAGTVRADVGRGGASTARSDGAPAGKRPRHSVTLSWLPVKTKARLVGYNVYRSSKSGGPYTKLTRFPWDGTRVIDYSVKAGQTYYYVVSTVDWQTGEGPKSKEISATVPQ